MTNDSPRQFPQLGFVGAGKMACAIASGVANRQELTVPILYADPYAGAREAFQQSVPNAEVCATNGEVASRAEVVVLAVKPQQMAAVATELGQAAANRLVISIAAGISLTRLAEWLGHDRVIRVMPNTPCLVGAGAAGFTAGTGATQEDREIVMSIFSSIGLAFEVSEPQLDAVTGVSGSGPAYVFAMIEALSDGGVLMGLPRGLSSQLAIQTVLGAARLAQDSQQHPAVLREQVTSPGGTTARALLALENGGFKATIQQAVEAAAVRARELGD